MHLKQLTQLEDNLNYGIIGNCKSSALINEDSSIDWCCLPQFDSPSVFGRILDEKKGGFFKAMKYILRIVILFRMQSMVFFSILK